MKILIIEDEQSNADRLCRLLRDIPTINTEVLAVASSNAEARDFFTSGGTMPEVILADIQLGDGLSFESLKEAPAHIPVIFTTAYDQYAINAFRYNGIAYLLKPIDPDELLDALGSIEERKVSASQSHPSDTDQLQQLLATLRDGGIRYRERFLIAFRDELRVVPISNVSHIALIEGDTYLFTTDGKQHPLSQTLEELESELNPNRFMRVNRQYIVSVDAVESLVANFLGKMRLKLRCYKDADIIVSRAKVPMVKKWLDS